MKIFSLLLLVCMSLNAAVNNFLSSDDADSAAAYWRSKRTYGIATKEFATNEWVAPCKTVLTLSTNVQTTDNRPTRWVQEPCPGNPMYLVACGHNEKYGEATEKTEVEIVTEITTKECKDGADVLTKEIGRREVSRLVRIYRLRPAEWVLFEAHHAAPIDHASSMINFITNTPMTNWIFRALTNGSSSR